ncbi:DNA sulfur modification protein DndD [Streptomyces roseochromogenus]|uniref:Nuclease SbcCD subunit C n=1 Tax=Streptomyces roseochromogenus subsp. oscitans DS 12.976 TaxID=1352936 RepID=V6K4A9_STRRC|nr:DNA sulfur modification protein DndD [Streptomyces roseochromogenus]EST26972.1 hypothetical protein M878_26115 [Streptomyces roseochromogenus subsp. oscitans DS 12.976]
MLLHNITLRDFGAYQGEQRLDLRTESGRPIVLIGGLNGCGKTTLLDAIQLVLYGPKADWSGRGRSYNDYLQQCINRKADEAEGASIALEFTVTVEGVERHYRVTRNWYVAGSKTLKEFVTVLIDGDFSRTLTETWADHVETILPIDVASLFFFDGEKIEELADPARAAKVIESAIYSLLGVSNLERLRNDLRVFQTRQRLEDADKEVLENFEAQERAYDAAKQATSDANQRLVGARTQLAAQKRELAKVERAFKDGGGEAYERRHELEKERDRAEEQVAATNKSLVSVAEGPLPLLLLRKELDELREQARLELDAEDASRVVGVLEQRDEWLLRQVEEALPASTRTELKKTLADDRQKRAAAADLEQNLELPHDMLVQLSTLDQALSTEAARARELVQEAEDAAEHLEVAKQHMSAVPEEDVVQDLVSRRSLAMEQVAMEQARVARAEAEHSEAEGRQRRLKEELDRSRRAHAEAKWNSARRERIIKYTDKTQETLAKLKDRLLSLHIENVEVAVLKSFNKLMRKQGLIRDIQIDTEKFTLVLTGPDDKRVDPGRLSAGERQLLAVSLLWGLAKTAGNRLPSIIDTPLGRLDSQHRQHLIDRYFPEAGRQVLLLSTDEEIDEQLYERLKPHVAHTYTLVHDDADFTTTVVPGYLWSRGAAHVA